MRQLFPRTERDIVFPLVGAGALFAVFVLCGLAYQSILGSGSAERLVTIMFIDAIIVIGIQIYVGNTGVLSFGHIGFGAIAGYVFAILAITPAEKARRIPNAPFGLDDVHVNPWIAVLIAIVVAVIVAVFVGIGLSRSGAQSGAVAATVITLALLFVTHEVARNWPKLTGGDRAGLAFRIGGSLDSRVGIYLGLFAALAIARLFAQSRSGRLAVAAREDDLAARAMGVNPIVQQMVALVISVVVVAIGASLRVYEVGSILPDDFFLDYTLVTLVMLIVGGRNSVTGALLGVTVMTVGRELARRLGSDGFEVFGIGLDDAPLDWIFRENLQTVFLGLSMLGFMIWRPLGVIDDWELDEWMHRRMRRDSAAAPAPLTEVEARQEVRLVADDIGVVFGGFTALEGVAITAASGEIVGIIGPNGAGKTTLVNVLTGMVEPTTGRFAIDDHDLTNQRSFELARSGLVRTFQNLRLFTSLTVRENVEASALVAGRHRSARAIPSVDALIAEAGLWEHRNRRAGELDYGNSRRLELARAVAMAPSFLLLDEPTSGMSDSESEQMIEQVRHMAATVGAGVLVIDHDLNFITNISDRIYALDQGRVIAHGTPDAVQRDAQVRAAYLGSLAGE